jgi:hypothetical protein
MDAARLIVCIVLILIAIWVITSPDFDRLGL